MSTPDTSMHLDGALFIGGAWRPAASGDTRQVINPFDGSALQRVDEAGAVDARAAVAAARVAFDDGPWRTSSAAERSAILFKVADLLQRNRSRIATIETLDTGKTLTEAGI